LIYVPHLNLLAGVEWQDIFCFGFESLDSDRFRFFLIVNLNKLYVVCQNKSWLRSPLLNRHVFCQALLMPFSPARWESYAVALVSF